MNFRETLKSIGIIPVIQINDAEKAVLRETVASLPQRERIIMEMRFGMKTGKEMTQKEVADVIGISQSYISRLEKKIIKKLKKELDRQML